MTDVSAGQPNAPLGIGSIIGESFSILFGKFFQVVLIAFGPAVIGLVISGLLIGFGAMSGTAEPDLSGGAGSAFAILFAVIIQFVVYAVTTALLVQLAYDAKLGRSIQIGRYIGPAFSSVLPIVVLSLVAGVLFMIGFALLIVPGLWIYAVFAVMAPAVVIEKAGFGGLGRSAALTKEYRWPIVGAFVLIIIISIVINMVAGLIIGVISALVGSVIVDVILSAALSTIGAGLGSIMVALIYARLREIKEGVSVDQIAAVFD
ncbi:hypothetical protein [Roseibium sediminicola]|uniref:Glycerophosphoryl diester phosphodiesterase membrane domain-containing protein n=1 Tax=Roseibium sediminicola TaxID=2933272 RepID=A0ABT0GSA9_9HYPH|nr:hypothetical protein [Roseibium sp. CAU 1639]MCK7612317.1 hypothetical protein [Roseibium sp. CAU 1639]